MFFILSKTAALLALPSNFLILLLIVGLALMLTRFKRSGRTLAIVGVVALLIVGFLPVGTILLHQLESRFPPWDASRGAPDGIIVLGGAIAPRLSRDYGQTIVTRDANRLTALAKLAHEYPKARIVYAGGDASLRANKLPETDFVGPLFDAFALPRERMLLETRSRNTAENAAFSKELVQPKPGERWLLITSAWHMPRAIGCFRQVGFAVEAYPTGWRTRRKLSLYPADVFSDGLGLFDLAVHEWMGLFMYRITGRIDEMFPSPATR